MTGEGIHSVICQRHLAMSRPVALRGYEGSDLIYMS
jgi:hypothetical protein